MPIPHCFDYCNFVVSFKIGKCESSYFVFLFQYCFGLPWSLIAPYEFENHLLHFCKKTIRILIRIELNL